MPFGKGKRWGNADRAAAAVLGGWQMNGSLSVLSGNRLNFGGNAGVLRVPGNSNTLNHFGRTETPKGNGQGTQWFDPTICTATITRTALGSRLT